MRREAGHTEAISQQGHYAGAVTRLAAFVVDQSAATFAFSVGTAVVAWTISLVTGGDLDVEITGWITVVAYALWLLLYFSYPWSVSGKTLGMALLGIQVVSAEGARCGTRSAVLRTLALPLSFLTLGIGFVPIVVGRHRRALHDRIAGTAVVYGWDAQAARWRFLARSSDREVADPATAAPAVAAQTVTDHADAPTSDATQRTA